MVNKTQMNHLLNKHQLISEYGLKILSEIM